MKIITNLLVAVKMDLYQQAREDGELDNYQVNHAENCTLCEKQNLFYPEN